MTKRVHFASASLFLLAAAIVAGLPANVVAQTAAAKPEKLAYAIAIHGGAGGWANLPDKKRAEILADLEKALTVGRDILAKGGTSLDAVEQTVRALEDAPHFNAGKGATYTATGHHQLDASIMNGADHAAGAVASVSTVKNPISLARRVMSDTKHIILAGDGADKFALEVGAETVPPEYFWTDHTRAEYEKAKAKAEEEAKAAKQPAAANATFAIEHPDHYGTVGCVALDTHGNLAAATSTGGLAMKKFGRIGDSPIIGAGTYADNATCAISGTGVGEFFIRNAVCYDVAARMRYAGATLAEAASAQINERLPKDTAGVIAVNAAGEIFADFNTRAMPRGMADSSGRFEVAVEAETEKPAQ